MDASRDTRPPTFDTLHAPGLFLAPRLWQEAHPWSPAGINGADVATGGLIGCAGSMPIVCHRASLSPAALAAMAVAGISVAADIHPYADRESYRARLRALLDSGRRAMTVYWTPPEVAPRESTWIDPDLQAHLNNKANLPSLVAADHVPTRRIAAGADAIARAVADTPLPFVAKVATDLPNFGGGDVMMARRHRHRARIARRFRDAGAVVVEEILDIVANQCVQFAVGPDGAVRYLGAAAQICLPNGAHAGNLISPGSPPSEAMIEVGRAIAATGAAKGYRGVAGFDIVQTRDGRNLAIDLNFRPVSSTAQVLLHPALAQARGLPVSRLAFGEFAGDLADLLRLLRDPIAAGWVAPLALFDPALGETPGGPACARILLFGASEGAISGHERRLAAAGLRLAGGRSGPLAAARAAVARLFPLGAR